MVVIDLQQFKLQQSWTKFLGSVTCVLVEIHHLWLDFLQDSKKSACFQCKYFTPAPLLAPIYYLWDLYCHMPTSHLPSASPGPRARGNDFCGEGFLKESNIMAQNVRTPDSGLRTREFYTPLDGSNIWDNSVFWQFHFKLNRLSGQSGQFDFVYGMGLMDLGAEATQFELLPSLATSYRRQLPI